MFIQHFYERYYRSYSISIPYQVLFVQGLVKPVFDHFTGYFLILFTIVICLATWNKKQSILFMHALPYI